MIRFEHVTYTYPEAASPALNDLSLELPEGQLILVVGPSGAGKSTLLRCLNGLVPHFSGGMLRGAVRIGELDPVRATPRVLSRRVGFVFQDPEAQFVTEIVEDEIAFALENAAMSPQEMRVRVEETLDLLDLTPLRDRPIKTLSGGERQRVAIAAALALRPSILALDEPTSQLDPKSAEDVLNSLVRLNHDLGLTIILVEHRLERVLPYVDSILYLPDHGEPALFDDVRSVMGRIELAPPLVRLGKALGWRPLPLTIKEGLRFSRPWLAERNGTFLPRTQTGQAPSHRGEPYIRARGVRVRFGQQEALRGVDFDLWPGEIVVLMGRNGAGKTTLLRSLVGLVRPQAGVIHVAGQHIAGQDVAAICRKVGYLPQDPNTLLFAESVQEELKITLRNHQMKVEEERIAALLQRLNLSDKADAYPRDLSVGERQRVALAAISVTEPGALLLDEPTRGLDYAAKHELERMLREWRNEGMAILVVTHDVELAAAIADRVILMSQGEMIAQGSPASVLATSPLFAPQIARLFPETGWLTVEDVLGANGRCQD
ncbi:MULTISPECIES: ABC transporter ATP-binding protein [Caldilinea]|jgi:energy-coupling factor transport system ATP-binding protein|uniref:Putative ABC transporter ATP-binding protein n=1 Tax=Caldilinea aerophila (strain DSM 14535 / JCM 11387 / NBRC 104270 / STL-6-O1) TaxID=926550 RepID=I0I804_CALAS|nr:MULTISPECIES: ABC transporter ATP-binding protein [Caldilinea]BAM01392.1 putative ABC transporter ATP-binding protein [Caldilinea aerophila DSM 14535 = NBRC 104270]GIV72731.1 MAG: ABC transporter [Caldilinea sp.]